MKNLVAHGLLQECLDAGVQTWKYVSSYARAIIAFCAPIEACDKYYLESSMLLEKKHFDDMRPWYAVQVTYMTKCRKSCGNFSLLVERAVTQLNIDEAFLEALGILRAVRPMWPEAQLESLVSIAKTTVAAIIRANGKVSPSPCPWKRVIRRMRK